MRHPGKPGILFNAAPVKAVENKEFLEKFVVFCERTFEQAAMMIGEDQSVMQSKVKPKFEPYDWILLLSLPH